jgi:hypothetical protein
MPESKTPELLDSDANTHNYYPPDWTETIIGPNEIEWRYDPYKEIGVRIIPEPPGMYTVTCIAGSNPDVDGFEEFDVTSQTFKTLEDAISSGISFVYAMNGVINEKEQSAMADNETSTTDTDRPNVVIRWNALGGMVEKKVDIDEIKSIDFDRPQSDNPITIRFKSACMPWYCCTVDYPAEKRYIGPSVGDRSLPASTDEDC